jgi:hypothetical protein
MKGKPIYKVYLENSHSIMDGAGTLTLQEGNPHEQKYSLYCGRSRFDDLKTVHKAERGIA